MCSDCSAGQAHVEYTTKNAEAYENCRRAKATMHRAGDVWPKAAVLPDDIGIRPFSLHGRGIAKQRGPSRPLAANYSKNLHPRFANRRPWLKTTPPKTRQLHHYCVRYWTEGFKSPPSIDWRGAKTSGACGQLLRKHPVCDFAITGREVRPSCLTDASASE